MGACRASWGPVAPWVAWAFPGTVEGKAVAAARGGWGPEEEGQSSLQLQGLRRVPSGEVTEQTQPCAEASGRSAGRPPRC